MATALLDLANGVETGVTLRKTVRAMAAVTVGVLSGAGSGTEVTHSIGNDATTRVTTAATSVGNRTAVTLTL